MRMGIIKWMALLDWGHISFFGGTEKQLFTCIFK